MQTDYKQKNRNKTTSFNRFIIFDGECGLCNRGVRFLLKRDLKEQFRYTSLQGEFVKSLYVSHPGLAQLDTLIYLRNDVVYIKSTAVLNIVRDLGGKWAWLYLLKWVPKRVRDFIYDTITKHRHKLFGRNTCLIHQASKQKYFID